MYVALPQPPAVSTGAVEYVRAAKNTPKKKQGAENRRPLRPGESLRLVLAFVASSVLRGYHPWLRSNSDLAARLIRFFRQLEQHPHQFRVIQRLLAAEEPILDETVHRRLGAAKFG